MTHPLYVIKHDNGTYYRQWTLIGPMFGAVRANAMVFGSREAATQEQSRHYGFMETTIEEKSGNGKKASIL